MARSRKGAARAAAPGSLFVWVNTPTGRQLVSRRRAEQMKIEVAAAKPSAKDSDEETEADARTETSDVVETDASGEPVVAETTVTESVTAIDVEGDAPATKPMTSRKAGSRKPAARSKRQRG